MTRGDGGFCLGGSLSRGCLSRESLSRESLSMGDLSLGAGGSLSRESLSGGSLSMGVRVSVHGGEGLCPGGSLLGDPPRTVTSGRYASYWNAFLLQC